MLSYLVCSSKYVPRKRREKELSQKNSQYTLLLQILRTFPKEGEKMRERREEEIEG